MAEGNLCVVANRILEMLRREDTKKMGSLWRVPQELLREPEDTILTLAPLLIEVEKRSLHYHNEALKEWLRQLGEELYDADNLLDDFNTAALRRRSMSSSRRLKMVQVTKTVHRFFSTSSNPALNTDRFKVLGHLTKIKRALDYFASDLPKFRLEESSGTSTDDDGEFQVVPVPVPGERESSTEPSFVFKEEKAYERAYDREAVVKLLLDQEFQENVSILPIIGMEGPGKTTLARDVFDDVRVRKHFSERIWVCVSDDLDLKKILKQVVVCATNRSVEFLDIGLLEHLLRELLLGKRYLIVLDDVCNPDSAKWDQLKHVLQFVAGASGSAIILTSRCEKVARISGSIEPYCLYHLSHEQSWNLFQRIAFGEKDSQECQSSEMISIGRQIVRQCGSHPFLISAIGGMLYFKKTEAEWRFFYEKEFFRMENTDHKRQLLKLCYDDLPSPLKHCFAFCSLFPKDHEIDVQTLVKLWMAHGFIHLQSSHQSFEDVGYGYFLNLRRRSFFHEVIMDVKGRVTKCRMHDLMHDLATDVAGEHCLLLGSQIGSGYPHRRASHVSFAFNLLPSAGQVLGSFKFVEKLQSILFLTRTEDKIFDTMISRCRFLRVLDMHALGIKKVPYSIGNLYHLRYLDLSENEDITELPNSITELLHLQTLRLSSCFKLKKLPRHIGNLINLRHLEIDGCYDLLSLPRGIARLTNLQTLSQVVLSENASTRRDQLKQLGRLKNFRGKFEIKNLKHGKDEIGAYLSEKWGVRSLSLEWENRAPKLDEDGKPLDTLLFSDLDELALNGFRGATLFQPSFPDNLVKLSLRRWIKGTHLPPLHQCVKLKVLVLAEITNLEFVENEPVSLSMTFFPSLRELWLIKLPELQGWSKTSSLENQELPSFPCLSKLVIEDCPKLVSMPLFPTLEEGLVLESTCLNSFRLTMKHKLATAAAADEASSSSNAPSSPLSKLKNLCIVGIDKFDDSKADEIAWDNLQSLKLLELDNLPELKTLPEGLKHVSSLRELHVWRSGVTEIPAWIGELKSLEKLVIRVCPKLKALPDIKDWRLKALEIEGCPTLIRRCEEGIGADWDKVKHIDLRLGRWSMFREAN